MNNPVPGQISSSLYEENTDNSVFEKLIKALKENDDPEIRRWYMHCFNKIKHYAATVLADEFMGEEAASHVFEKLLLHYEKINLPSNWIFTVTRNWCRTRKCRSARRKIIRDELYIQTLQTISKPDGYSHLIEEDLTKIINHKLDAREQKIFYMNIEGYDCYEIGSSVGISPKTVSNCKSKIRNQLKKSLATKQYSSVIL